MSDPLTLQYYSDVLCIWAWIAERRNQELLEECGEQVNLECHFLDLFSDVDTRICAGWKEKGGYEGFGRHVREAAEPYQDAPVHADVWNKVRPTTSANSHLVIQAARLVSGAAKARPLATHLRESFFACAIDIGSLETNLELCEEQGFARSELREVIESGRAIAALLSDNKLAHEHRVAGSPTWIMNSGRQTLYGNVGYRVLHANVEELLRRPAHEASWC
jgi:predicted DsbA family dithiol-disulfide isomerase